jgi:UDP-N-acetylmuramyl pentapeptide synthase
MAADRITMFPDARAAAAVVPAGLVRGDVVLLKASRSVHLELVADAIKTIRQPKSDYP